MSLTAYYEIIDSTVAENQAHYLIRLIPDHPMYAGHFPDLAVMPGVVQLQLIEELLSKSLNHNLRLKSSKNIKFLKMILPTEFQIIKIVLTWKIDELIQLQAEIQSLHELPSIITKYQAQFEIIR